MTTPNRPAVFIEKIFPVTLLNQQVYYEHGGNPFKGLHRWYSRKPLSFSRASVLGSLLPDTVTPEEFEYLLGLQRRLGGQPDTTTKLYKTPPSTERIKQVHDLCEQTWGTRTPTVLDAFAGGGSIPFEAVRYGLNVLASDLNPVAVVTMKAAMEYPLKFGPDLQHEIDKWVKWVGDEAEKRLGEFFPSGEEHPPQPPFARGEKSEVPLEKGDLGGCNLNSKRCHITAASADNLSHIPDKSLDAVVTDPPYYATIQYSELSDFFYVWQKRVLGDIFPELYFSELTDKDREAVANPSRFRNMGKSAEELANRDYEAKMALAFAEYCRVLRDDGVMTVQFNHKDSGAWDVLAKSLIDAGFEITASWAVSTENPQNLRQAQKNSVSSTVLLVCRKRDPKAGSAWWYDLRPELANLVEQRAPEFEANDINGIDLYLEEQSIDPVRRFLKATGLLSNDLFMRVWEVALKAIPQIGDQTQTHGGGKGPGRPVASNGGDSGQGGLPAAGAGV